MDPHSASGGGDFHGDPADAINASTACYIGTAYVCASLGDGESVDAIAGADEHAPADFGSTATSDGNGDSEAGRERVNGHHGH